MLLVKDGMSPMYMDLLLDCIIDYWKTTEAIKQEDAFIESQNGTKRRKETTKGWEILICWKDGSTTWNKMKDVKDSYPVQLAESMLSSRELIKNQHLHGGCPTQSRRKDES